MESIDLIPLISINANIGINIINIWIDTHTPRLPKPPTTLDVPHMWRWFTNRTLGHEDHSDFISVPVKAAFSPDLPCLFMAAFACLTASQGLGMSRKTASATPVTPKPSLHTSWFLTVTRWSTRCSLNSSAAFSARCWWNSTVCRWPVGAMVRSMACEREPLPVPAARKMARGVQVLWRRLREPSL